MSLTELINWVSGKGPVGWVSLAVVAYYAYKFYNERFLKPDSADMVDYHLRELAKAAAHRKNQGLVDFVNGYQAEFRKVGKSE